MSKFPARLELPRRLLEVVASPVPSEATRHARLSDGAYRLLLDLGIGVSIAAVFLRLADPDMLFHVVFVLLSMEAFAYRLRTAAPRMAVAFGAVLLDVWVPGGMTLEDFLVEWPLMFLIAGMVSIMAARRDELVRHYARLFRAASDRLINAEEDERRRVALDLHDGVGQTLTAIGLTLDEALRKMRPDDPSRPHVERARAVAEQAIEETRDVAQRLRPAGVRGKGLVEAVRSLARSSGLPVQVIVEPGVDGLRELEPGTVLSAYRIVQEALGNAGRHSHAGRVRITFGRTADGVAVEVRDDGIGFDRADARDRGLGLVGMAERAASFGGSLTIASSPGAGTTVRLQIPRTGPKPSGAGEHRFEPHSGPATRPA